MELKVADICDATRGRLLRGSPEDVVAAFSTDTRTLRSGEFFIPLRGEHFDGHDFLSQAADRGASGTFIDRDVESDILDRFPLVIRVRDTLRALSDVALEVRNRVRIPIIGITGSNGKTTAKELTAAVLGENVLKAEASFNNLVGVSRTLLRLEPHHRFAVLEIGTNHFGEIAELVALARPTVGVFLNVSATHTEFLEDEDGVAREKSVLPLSTESTVLNADDPRVIAIAPRCRDVWTFGIEREAHVYARNIDIDGEGHPTFTLHIRGREAGRVRLRVLGRHHVYNALAAAAVGALFRVAPEEIVARLADADPPKMRLERLTIDGVVFLNDAYNANPASVRAALDLFRVLSASGRRWIVLGEMLELGGDEEAKHREIVRMLSPEFCDVFVVLGPFADAMAEEARRVGIPAILRVRDVDEVARTLRSLALPGDLVLLKASRRVQLERVLSTYKD